MKENRIKQLKLSPNHDYQYQHLHHHHITSPGAYVEGDGPDQSFIPKPDWLDEEKFKKGRHFVREYTFGMMFGYLLVWFV